MTTTLTSVYWVMPHILPSSWIVCTCIGLWTRQKEPNRIWSLKFENTTLCMEHQYLPFLPISAWPWIGLLSKDTFLRFSYIVYHFLSIKMATFWRFCLVSKHNPLRLEKRKKLMAILQRSSSSLSALLGRIACFFVFFSRQFFVYSRHLCV